MNFPIAYILSRSYVNYVANYVKKIEKFKHEVTWITWQITWKNFGYRKSDSPENWYLKTDTQKTHTLQKLIPWKFIPSMKQLYLYYKFTTILSNPQFGCEYFFVKWHFEIFIKYFSIIIISKRGWCFRVWVFSLSVFRVSVKWKWLIL